MKTLWLLRHAKSAWNTNALTDFDRPLAKRGLRDAPRIGNWLNEHHATIDRVVCSSACRASQTLERVREHWLVEGSVIEHTDALYHAGARDLKSVVQSTSNDSNQLLLVGHNPGLDSLLMGYCGHDLPLSDSGKLMTTAALAQIALADWSATTGQLIELVRPKELR